MQQKQYSSNWIESSAIIRHITFLILRKHIEAELTSEVRTWNYL